MACVWAGELAGACAAAGVSPAAANAAPAAQPPAGFAQNAVKPDAPTAPVSQQSAAAGPTTVATPPNSYGAYKETPAANDAGEPILGGKGIQKQVTPIGEEAAAFHNDWLLPLCGVISLIEVRDIDRDVLATSDQLTLAQAGFARAVARGHRTPVGSDLLGCVAGGALRLGRGRVRRKSRVPRTACACILHSCVPMRALLRDWRLR